ncbi:MAG: hypothetical protein RBT49_00300 [Bacteroidales bacterium]|jgi:hypothetical protein|nr:hypothetical protein [Bacteroidales bacterium]
MKNKSICFAFIILFVVQFSSCENDDNPVPDPIGTITTTLDYTGIIVYSDLAVDAPYSNYNYIKLVMGMTLANLNSGFNTMGSPDGQYWDYMVGYQSGELTNLGKVEGLCYVTTKPSSGYTKNGTIEKGNGYVVRSKKYFINTTDAPYIYYRFFVEDWIVNTSGGINGAKIKIQGPF